MDAWYADPNRVMFVAENSQGKIIAFESLGQFDGGRTLMTQALRVSESSRGQGVAKMLAAKAQEVGTHFALLYHGVPVSGSCILFYFTHGVQTFVFLLHCSLPVFTERCFGLFSILLSAS